MISTGEVSKRRIKANFANQLVWGQDAEIYVYSLLSTRGLNMKNKKCEGRTQQFHFYQEKWKHAPTKIVHKDVLFILAKNKTTQKSIN